MLPPFTSSMPAYSPAPAATSSSSPAAEKLAKVKAILDGESLNWIRDILGNETFEALPILDLQGRFGKTDYIDFLTASDLSAPAMKGVDHLQRPFIAFKAENKVTGEKFTQVIFQRYTDDPGLWVSAGKVCANGACNMGLFGQVSPATIYKEKLQLLATVLQGTNDKFVLRTDDQDDTLLNRIAAFRPSNNPPL
jgi:hypothetical protein